mgnify:CR=1 FL=1
MGLPKTFWNESRAILLPQTLGCARLIPNQRLGEAMRAKELVPILAEEWGVPLETADVIDRALADAGHRAKGRGRDVPDMSAREAVTFLLACMVAEKPTRADEAILPWIEMPGRIIDAPETEHGRELIEGLVGQPVHSSLLKEILPALGLVCAFGGDPDAPVSIIDLLVAICAELRKDGGLNDEADVEICLSHKWARVTIADTNYGAGDRKESSQIRFEDVSSSDLGGLGGKIVRSVRIDEFALTSIAMRTAD